MRINCLWGVIFWMANHQRSKPNLSQGVRDHGPKSSTNLNRMEASQFYLPRGILVAAVFMRTTTILHKTVPSQKHLTCDCFASGFIKQALPSMQDYKLLDFNTAPNLPTPCCRRCHQEKNRNKNHLAFSMCIMSVLMAIYTDSFLSSTGIFTIEAVSVCVDITVCAENDWAMSHIF